MEVALCCSLHCIKVCFCGSDPTQLRKGGQKEKQPVPSGQNGAAMVEPNSHLGMRGLGV